MNYYYVGAWNVYEVRMKTKLAEMSGWIQWITDILGTHDTDETILFLITKSLHIPNCTTLMSTMLNLL